MDNRERSDDGRRAVRLHDRIVSDLGHSIVAGKHAPGEVLPHIDELRQSYGGAGRSTVREAIRVLSSKGLVRSRQRVGTVVAPRSSWNLLDPTVLAWMRATDDSPAWLREVMEVRRMLEPQAAALAAERATPDDVARIRDAYERMAQTHPERASVAPDLDFHEAIAAASGNEMLAHLIGNMSGALHDLFEESLTKPDASDFRLPRHLAILVAIEAGDARGAFAASTVHLDMTEAIFSELDAGTPPARRTG